VAKQHLFYSSKSNQLFWWWFEINFSFALVEVDTWLEHSIFTLNRSSIENDFKETGAVIRRVLYCFTS
jgi:hypothetical protein